MKKMRRITALFLCVLMMFPAQAMTIFADTDESSAVVSTSETTETEESADEIKTGTDDKISETINVGELDKIEETPAAEDTDSSETRIEETLAVEPTDASEERIEETLKVEELERIEEVLPIEPLVVWNEDAMIYWNPGGQLPAELASASDAVKAADSSTMKATASNIKKGRDSADGMSPERPVKSLSKALEQAEKLKEELGVETSEITIYAMSPMEITDGQLYVLNGANIRIASWPGRSYDNDTVFYINGGQLSLINTLLESGNQADDPEATQLITVHGGTLQLGQAVEINGQIAMDYRKIKDAILWETASDSNTATRSNTAINDEEGETTGFNINDYILSTDEESAELIEDTITVSTWCKPVIELMDGYEESSGEYLLEVNTDTNSNQIELVRTLSADELTGEEFLDYFTITYNDDAGGEWNLTAATTEAATIRNTASADTALYRKLEQELTADLDEELVSAAMSEETTSAAVASTKSLIATRDGSGTVRYWNPGGKIVLSSGEYPAGSDTDHDGTLPTSAFKTWEKAVANAQGGTIICMQSVTLGSGASEYIGNPQGDGSYLIQSTDKNTIVTLMVWDVQPQPAFIVPEGEELVLKNIKLAGISASTNTQTVLCQGGDIVIEENVTAETGYIQVDAFSDLAGHPVTVNSIYGEADGIITLFFGGINDNILYRFTDVVVPGDALSTVAADTVGQALLSRVVLDRANRDIMNGGQSKYDWSLRQDTALDDNVLKSQNLELYADYYYDAIYLDGVRGDDTGFGATCQYPVKTWDRAVEIWEDEIARSIAARTQAAAAGMSAADIDEYYPVPTVIYICGTVTVDEPENWELGIQYDYDGSGLVTEVRSHVDIPYNSDGTTLVHQLPQVLVEVKSGGDLSLKNLTIRNYTDEKASITLQVDSGGVLRMNENTLLTGEGLGTGSESTGYQEVTDGTHVRVIAGGMFVMNSGIIEHREHGVEGVGVNARITMNGGEIRKNNSYDEALFEAKNTDQIKGAGVVLSNKAEFVMNGGMITQNTVYQYGAGVYLTGSGTSFTMNKGSISDNQMAGYLSYSGAGNSATSDVHGYGIGIYAGQDTIVTLESSAGDAADTLVTNNIGYWADGIGVWTDGTLNVGKATISKNHNDTGGYTANVKKGLGLYAGDNARVTMDGAVVTGNYSNTTGYGNAHGAGIYLAYNTNGNSIKNSNITENIVGYENNTGEGYAGGGGIYLAGGVLDITDSVLEENAAYRGAGIMIYTTDTDQPITLNVSGTSIIKNKARYSRNETSTSSEVSGGGIYAYGHGTVNLATSTGIIDNTSQYSGGGLYIYGISSSSKMNLTMTGAYVNENTASYNRGGGMYVESYTTINANNVEINGNDSTNDNGGAIYAYGSGVYMYFKGVSIENNEANYGGGIYVNSSSEMYFNNVDIVHNTAKTGNGGGINGNGTLNKWLFYKTNIEDNTAAMAGGGIYGDAYSPNTVIRFLEVNIKGNTATTGDGGGCYFANGTHYLTDSNISNNSAGGQGGGLYYADLSTIDNPVLHFTENSAGSSSITDNKAVSGGGIYSVETPVYLDIAGEYQNTATEQGSNLYLQCGGNYICTGSFKQPSNQDEGVYNIYLDVPNETTHALYMDPQSVVIEKKNGSDAVYLNTTNSFLSYLQVPPSDVYGELPISVNGEVFKVGSIIVKPAKLSSSSCNRVIIGADGYASGTATYTRSYTKFEDAVINVNYSSGGSLPERTQIGGYKTNIVLLGEGVYLDGTAGSDSNSGTSPTDAVKTFTVAKEVLKDKILATETADSNKAVEDRVGFTPIIYICGNVIVSSDSISSDKTWELDYDDDLFLLNNANYVTAESGGDAYYDAQVRRFTSFVDKPMITVGGSETDVAEFTTRKIIIDGMANAVVYGDQGAQSPIVEVKNKSTVTMEGDTRITNNYYSGVDLYGTLVLSGNVDDENKQLLNHHGSYVRIMASNASLEMNGYSRIISEEGVTKIGALTCYAVYSSSYANVKIVMNDSSSIVNDAGSLLTHGIYLTGGELSEVLMQNSAHIDNVAGTVTAVDGAVCVTGENSKVTMKNSAYIQNCQYGIGIKGTSSSCIMQDSAAIQATRAGIYASGSSSAVHMEHTAKITVPSVISASYTYGGVVLAGTNSELSMGDSAQISGSGVRITALGTQIKMENNACLVGDGSLEGAGIYIYTSTSSDDPGILKMEDSAKITNYQYGINFYQCNHPYYVEMIGTAAIEQNKSGIYESTSTDNTVYGIERFSLEMDGDSKIYGNTSYGVSPGRNPNGGTVSAGTQNIDRKHKAIIRTI